MIVHTNNQTEYAKYTQHILRELSCFFQIKFTGYMPLARSLHLQIGAAAIVLNNVINRLCIDTCNYLLLWCF